MESEIPYWQNNNNNKGKSKYLSQFVGKNCSICIIKGIILPPSDSYTNSINAILEGYDDSFLYVSYTDKKKRKYKSLIDLNSITSITIVE